MASLDRGLNGQEFNPGCQNASMNPTQEEFSPAATAVNVTLVFITKRKVTQLAFRPGCLWHKSALPEDLRMLIEAGPAT